MQNPVLPSYDQLIVNEYIPGHGISAHVDAPKVFDDIITSVSLGSTCVMEFVNKETKKSIMSCFIGGHV